MYGAVAFRVVVFPGQHFAEIPIIAGIDAAIDGSAAQRTFFHEPSLLFNVSSIQIIVSSTTCSCPLTDEFATKCTVPVRLGSEISIVSDTDRGSFAGMTMYDVMDGWVTWNPRTLVAPPMPVMWITTDVFPVLWIVN